MTNRSKQKGTAAETAVVDYLRLTGFPRAERRALAGVNDKGDIAGVDDYVIEVKSCKAHDLAGWTKEAEIERKNANASFGVVIAKKKGTTDVGEWYAILPVWQLVDLIR